MTDVKVEVKYRKNSHEKYFTYEKELGICSIFDLVQTTLRETDVKRMEIIVEKIN